jgi:UDP-N-acetylmuramoyl-tripeptide--D-alanyl-D-alanine ligase
LIPTTIRALVEATGATLVAGDPDISFAGVSTDTRTLQPGDLFISLSGPNFDGNAFAETAVEGGAAGTMLRDTGSAPQPVSGGRSRGAPLLIHPDPRRALSQLADVVGITGSCGKTTTKNILRELLGAVVEDPSPAAVVASANSFNNDIGVPHTLFLADEATRVCVVEMGTNSPGEIASLCQTAKPIGGVITTVGAAHLEGLRSIEGVAHEKVNLIACLPREGFAVLNADSPWTPWMRTMTDAAVTTFSVEGDGDHDAREVWFHSAGTTFRLGEHEVTSPLLGLHNVQNLLAALATCTALGFDLERCLSAVSTLKPSHRRLERRVLGGKTLIDDSYNANPESARASVRVLAGLHGHERRVLVLGDMLELGQHAPELHHEVGELAASSGVDLLITVGELGKATAAGALEGGLSSDEVVHLKDVEAALYEVPHLVREGDVVLIKGSRQTGLDKVVQQMIEQGSGDAA